MILIAKIVKMLIEIQWLTNLSYHHFLDILEEREIADPPDLTEPFEDRTYTELGALLGN